MYISFFFFFFFLIAIFCKGRSGLFRVICNEKKKSLFFFSLRFSDGWFIDHHTALVGLDIYSVNATHGKVL